MTRGRWAVALLAFLVLVGGAPLDAQEAPEAEAEAATRPGEGAGAERPGEAAGPGAEPAAAPAAGEGAAPGPPTSGDAAPPDAMPPPAGDAAAPGSPPPGGAAAPDTVQPQAGDDAADVAPADEPAPAPTAPPEDEPAAPPATTAEPARPPADPRPTRPSAPTAGAEAPEPASGPLPRFEDGPCLSAMASELEAADARCGTLFVAENRTAEPLREIRLAIAILPPTGSAPAPDPVVFLHGGPGGSALRFSARWLTHPLREQRAIILVDERGSGESRPLICPDLQLEDFRVIAQNLRAPKEEPVRVEAARACRDELLAGGFDLGAWNSDAIADDVEDLRRTLGYESWNVFGLSYGTKLALTLLRRHPEPIRSVVLDSVYPPNVPGWDARVASFARALDAVGQACGAQEACAEAFPDSQGDLLAILAQLDERPIIVPTRREDLLPSGRFVINASDFAITIHQLLYDYRNIPLLPLFLREFRADPATPAVALADATTSRAVALSRGMALAVGCYERAPFASPEGRARLAAAHPELLAHFVYFLPDYAICDIWSEDQAGPRESRAVASEVPALILAGEFDPITPPGWGAITAETLPNSSVHVFPGLGHGADRSSSCARKLVAAFVDDPAAEPDARCIEAMPSIAFVTDHHPAPGMYALLNSLLVDRAPGAVLGFGTMIVLLLSGAVGWPLAGAWLVGSGSSRPGLHRAHLWIGAAAVLALALWGAVLAAVMEAVSAGGLLLILGLPAWTGPVFLLRWVVLGLSAIGIDALVRERAGIGSARFWHALVVGLVAIVAALLPSLLGLA